MNKYKKEAKWVGIGLILGVAIGSSLDFLYGFSGTTAAVGAGLGIVFGSIVGTYAH